MKKVSPNFHARFNALERTYDSFPKLCFHVSHRLWSKYRYNYRILCGTKYVSIFEQEKVWHVQEQLDIEAMKVSPILWIYSEVLCTEVFCFTFRLHRGFFLGIMISVLLGHLGAR